MKEVHNPNIYENFTLPELLATAAYMVKHKVADFEFLGLVGRKGVVSPYRAILEFPDQALALLQAMDKKPDKAPLTLEEFNRALPNVVVLNDSRRAQAAAQARQATR